VSEKTLTEQQEKWMASVRASLEKATGKPLEAWIKLADACPEAKPKARQKWFKDNHGLGQNYFMLVERERNRAAGVAPKDSKDTAAELWSDPKAAAIFEALKAAVGELPDLVTGQRKGYTSWSRSFAFAAARPVKGGTVRLGLAVEPGAGPRLEAATAKEGWSERLKSTAVLGAPGEVDAELKAFLRAAWERS